MDTLSNGYKKPESGDKGSSFFTAMEDNITRLNNHNHDGSNSEALTATAITAIRATIPLASWDGTGLDTGHYKQTVTIPAGFDFDTVDVKFRLTDGTMIFPTVERLTDTTYRVYSIDNTIDFIAVYGG